MDSASLPYDALFSGVIGQEYELLKVLNPQAAQMSCLVAQAVAARFAADAPAVAVVEVGGGTGITTLALLCAHAGVRVLSIDNEPVMHDQAKAQLRAWADGGRLAFRTDDALAALAALPAASADAVASAYTLHNFSDPYRRQVVGQIFRVLRPGGLFVNGDRYALDDIDQHTRLIQQEVSGYFQTLVGLDKLELLQHWVVHMFSDESENHVMRETAALGQLRAAGFEDISLDRRLGVNALVAANKPAEAAN